MRKIPLHSLVLLVGTSKLKEQEILESFNEDEIVSKRIISKKLFGDYNRHICPDVINSEMNRIINLKLSLGERIVISENNLSKNKRQFLTNIGQKFGVPIYYIIHIDESSNFDRVKSSQFAEVEDDILRGDGVASIIDTRIESFKVINKFPYEDLFMEVKRRGFNGVTVAGDIHGNLDGLKSSLEWALSRNLLYLQLGDLVDYGPKSLECVTVLYDSITRGNAINVIGNHDRKIERWLQQDISLKRNPEYLKNRAEVQLSESNKHTVEQIKNLSESERKVFEAKFSAIMNLGRYHYNMKNCSFSHAGILPEMFSINSDRLYGKFESMSLHGGYEENIEWIQTIPSDKLVFVGHTIKNRLIPEKINLENGSVVIFQDTGSGKGGYLTTTDLVFNDNQELSLQSHYRW